MDPALLYFMLVCTLWAALLFYVFYIRRASDLGAGGKAAFIIVTALLLPVLGTVLWQQHQAGSRLEELGFSVFQGLDNTIGAATGTGPSSAWVYSLNTRGEDLLDFYRQPEHHQGWTLTAATESSLVFEQKHLKMILTTSGREAAFQLLVAGETEPSSEPLD